MSPESPRADALDGRALAASLTVKDLARSQAWYTAVGFSVERKHEREGKLIAVSMKAGEVRILIGQDDGAKGLDRVKGEGFSLRITTDQNLDDLAKQIKARGASLASEPADMPWGVRVFRLEDPDGFKLLVSSVPKA
jgi:lactoylglutathione lyase